MLNKQDKERLISALKEMELQKYIITIRTRSTDLNDISNQSYENDALLVLYDNQKFCIYNERNCTSLELPYKKIKDLQINIDSNMMVEDDNNLEIQIFFMSGKTKYSVDNCG